MRLRPDYHEAQLMKARLLRRLKDETGSETILRSLTVGENVHPLVRAQGWAEIAQAHDRQGEYEQAMQSMLRCKELLREHETSFLQESVHLQTILSTLARSVTLAHFQRWSQAGQPRPHRGRQPGNRSEPCVGKRGR